MRTEILRDIVWEGRVGSGPEPVVEVEGRERSADEIREELGLAVYERLADKG